MQKTVEQKAKRAYKAAAEMMQTKVPVAKMIQQQEAQSAAQHAAQQGPKAVAGARDVTDDGPKIQVALKPDAPKLSDNIPLIKTMFSSMPSQLDQMVQISKSPGFSRSDQRFIAQTVKRAKDLITKGQASLEAAEKARQAKDPGKMRTHLANASMCLQVSAKIRDIVTSAYAQQPAKQKLYVRKAKRDVARLYRRARAGDAKKFFGSFSKDQFAKVIEGIKKADDQFRRIPGLNYDPKKTVKSHLGRVMRFVRSGKFKEAQKEILIARTSLLRATVDAFEKKAKSPEAMAAHLEITGPTMKKGGLVREQHMQNLAKGYRLVAKRFENASRLVKQGKMKQAIQLFSRAQNMQYSLDSAFKFYQFLRSNTISAQYRSAKRSYDRAVHKDFYKDILNIVQPLQEEMSTLADATDQAVKKLISKGSGPIAQKAIDEAKQGITAITRSAGTIQGKYAKVSKGLQAAQIFNSESKKFYQMAGQMKAAGAAYQYIRALKSNARLLSRLAFKAALNPEEFSFSANKKELDGIYARSWRTLGLVGGIVGGLGASGASHPLWSQLAKADVSRIKQMLSPLTLKNTKMIAHYNERVELMWRGMRLNQELALSAALNSGLLTSSLQKDVLDSLSKSTAALTKMNAAGAKGDFKLASKYGRYAIRIRSDVIEKVSKITNINIVTDAVGQFLHGVAGLVFTPIMVTDIVHEIGLNYTHMSKAEVAVKGALAVASFIPAVGTIAKLGRGPGIAGTIGKLGKTGRVYKQLGKLAKEAEAASLQNAIKLADEANLAARSFNEARTALRAAEMSGSRAAIAQAKKLAKIRYKAVRTAVKKAEAAKDALGVSAQVAAAPVSRAALLEQTIHKYSGGAMLFLGLADFGFQLEKNNWQWTPELVLGAIQQGVFGAAAGGGILMMRGARGRAGLRAPEVKPGRIAGRERPSLARAALKGFMEEGMPKPGEPVAMRADISGMGILWDKLKGAARAVRAELKLRKAERVPVGPDERQVLQDAYGAENLGNVETIYASVKGNYEGKGGLGAFMKDIGDIAKAAREKFGLSEPDSVSVAFNLMKEGLPRDNVLRIIKETKAPAAREERPTAELKPAAPKETEAAIPLTRRKGLEKQLAERLARDEAKLNKELEGLFAGRGEVREVRSPGSLREAWEAFKRLPEERKNAHKAFAEDFNRANPELAFGTSPEYLFDAFSYQAARARGEITGDFYSGFVKFRRERLAKSAASEKMPEGWTSAQKSAASNYDALPLEKKWAEFEKLNRIAMQGGRPELVISSFSEYLRIRREFWAADAAARGKGEKLNFLDYVKARKVERTAEALGAKPGEVIPEKELTKLRKEFEEFVPTTPEGATSFDEMASIFRNLSKDPDKAAKLLYDFRNYALMYRNFLNSGKRATFKAFLEQKYANFKDHYNRTAPKGASSFDEVMSTYRDFLKDPATAGKIKMYDFQFYLSEYHDFIRSGKTATFGNYLEQKYMMKAKSRGEAFHEVAVTVRPGVKETYGQARGAYERALETFSEKGLLGRDKTVRPADFTAQTCFDAYVAYQGYAKGTAAGKKTFNAHMKEYASAVVQGKEKGTFREYLSRQLFEQTGKKLPEVARAGPEIPRTITKEQYWYLMEFKRGLTPRQLKDLGASTYEQCVAAYESLKGVKAPDGKPFLKLNLNQYLLDYARYLKRRQIEKGKVHSFEEFLRNKEKIPGEYVLPRAAPERPAVGAEKGTSVLKKPRPEAGLAEKPAPPVAEKPKPAKKPSVSEEHQRRVKETRAERDRAASEYDDLLKDDQVPSTVESLATKETREALDAYKKAKKENETLGKNLDAVPFGSEEYNAIAAKKAAARDVEAKAGDKLFDALVKEAESLPEKKRKPVHEAALKLREARRQQKYINEAGAKKRKAASEYDDLLKDDQVPSTAESLATPETREALGAFKKAEKDLSTAKKELDTAPLGSKEYDALDAKKKAAQDAEHEAGNKLFDAIVREAESLRPDQRKAVHESALRLKGAREALAYAEVGQPSPPPFEAAPAPGARRGPPPPPPSEAAPARKPGRRPPPPPRARKRPPPVRLSKERTPESNRMRASAIEMRRQRVNLEMRSEGYGEAGLGGAKESSSRAKELAKRAFQQELEAARIEVPPRLSSELTPERLREMAKQRSTEAKKLESRISEEAPKSEHSQERVNAYAKIDQLNAEAAVLMEEAARREVARAPPPPPRAREAPPKKAAEVGRRRVIPGQEIAALQSEVTMSTKKLSTFLSGDVLSALQKNRRTKAAATAYASARDAVKDLQKDIREKTGIEKSRAEKRLPEAIKDRDAAFDALMNDIVDKADSLAKNKKLPAEMRRTASELKKARMKLEEEKRLAGEEKTSVWQAGLKGAREAGKPRPGLAAMRSELSGLGILYEKLKGAAKEVYRELALRRRVKKAKAERLTEDERAVLLTEYGRDGVEAATNVFTAVKDNYPTEKGGVVGFFEDVRNVSAAVKKNYGLSDADSVAVSLQLMRSGLPRERVIAVVNKSRRVQELAANLRREAPEVTKKTLKPKEEPAPEPTQQLVDGMSEQLAKANATKEDMARIAGMRDLTPEEQAAYKIADNEATRLQPQVEYAKRILAAQEAVAKAESDLKALSPRSEKAVRDRLTREFNDAKKELQAAQRAWSELQTYIKGAKAGVAEAKRPPAAAPKAAVKLDEVADAYKLREKAREEMGKAESEHALRENEYAEGIISEGLSKTKEQALDRALAEAEAKRDAAKKNYDSAEKNYEKLLQKLAKQEGEGVTIGDVEKKVKRAAMPEEAPEVTKKIRRKSKPTVESLTAELEGVRDGLFALRAARKDLELKRDLTPQERAQHEKINKQIEQLENRRDQLNSQIEQLRKPKPKTPKERKMEVRKEAEQKVSDAQKELDAAKAELDNTGLHDYSDEQISFFAGQADKTLKKMMKEDPERYPTPESAMGGINAYQSAAWKYVEARKKLKIARDRLSRLESAAAGEIGGVARPPSAVAGQAPEFTPKQIRKRAVAYKRAERKMEKAGLDPAKYDEYIEGKGFDSEKQKNDPRVKAALFEYGVAMRRLYRALPEAKISQLSEEARRLTGVRAAARRAKEAVRKTVGKKRKKKTAKPTKGSKEV